MAKKRKSCLRMRFRKNDPAHNVIVAVNRWIRAHGGSALLIGGIEVQDWMDGLAKYRVAVRVIGRKPSKGLKDGV